MLLGCCFLSPANSLLSLISSKREGAAHVLLIASNKEARTPTQLPLRYMRSPDPPLNQSSCVTPLFSMTKCLPTELQSQNFHPLLRSHMWKVSKNRHVFSHYYKNSFHSSPAAQPKSNIQALSLVNLEKYALNLNQDGSLSGFVPLCPLMADITST